MLTGIIIAVANFHIVASEGNTMKRSIFIVLVMFIGAMVAGSSIPSWGQTLSIDQIIYQPSAGLDEMQLHASATAEVVGNALTITLTNTSGFTGGNSSGLLLTGIGFELPTGVMLTNGGAYVAGGSTGYYKIGNTSYSLPGGANLSGEWGGGSPGGSGPFANVATLNVDYVAATLQSAFYDGSPFDSSQILKNPADVNGPEFGLLSNNFANAGGLGYVKDSLTLTWIWTGTGLTTDFLNNGNVVVSFGSPTAVVPEPSTLLLLGSGLLMIGGLGRRRLGK